MRGMRRALLVGAAMAGLAPATARAADAEVAEVVVAGRLEETLPQKLAEYGNRLEVVAGDEVQKGLYTDVATVLSTSLPGLSLIPQAGPFS